MRDFMNLNLAKCFSLLYLQFSVGIGGYVY